MRIIIIILLVFLSINIDAQTHRDTVQVSEFNIVLDFPGEYIKKATTYEEGVFYDYIIPQDSSIITIHLGSMVSLPLIEKKDIILHQLRVVEKLQNVTGLMKSEDK